MHSPFNIFNTKTHILPFPLQIHTLCDFGKIAMLDDHIADDVATKRAGEQWMDGWGEMGVFVCHLVSEHKWHWGGRKVGWWRGRGKIRQQSGHLSLHSQRRRPRTNVAMSLAIQNGVWLNNLQKKHRYHGQNRREKSTERQKKRLNTPQGTMGEKPCPRAQAKGRGGLHPSNYPSISLLPPFFRRIVSQCISTQPS